jgi:hypothetical protein
VQDKDAHSPKNRDSARRCLPLTLLVQNSNLQPGKLLAQKVKRLKRRSASFEPAAAPSVHVK